MSITQDMVSIAASGYKDGKSPRYARGDEKRALLIERPEPRRQGMQQHRCHGEALSYRRVQHRLLVVNAVVVEIESVPDAE
jgi:hypothetical protein